MIGVIVSCDAIYVAVVTTLIIFTCAKVTCCKTRVPIVYRSQIYTTMNILKTLKRKLRNKISLMQEKRRRRNGSLYPRIVPQHLSQIDVGEELIRAPSITSLQEPLTRVPSLTSLQSTFSDFNFAEQESPEELPLTRSPSLTSLSSDDQPSKEEVPLVATDEGFCDSSQPKLWPVDTTSDVQLVELRLTADSKLSGTVMVTNLAYHKNIFIRWTDNNWASYQDTVASYDDSSEGFSHDWFTFTIDSDSVCKDTAGGVCFELAVAYQVNGMEFWDNNEEKNYTILSTQLQKENSSQPVSVSSGSSCRTDAV